MSDADEQRIFSSSREIEADAATIFELIADPAQQVWWDGNDNLGSSPAGQRVRGVGAVFVTLLKNGLVRENHVVEFEESRLIAWTPAEVDTPPPGHLWRWKLEPLDDGCTLVTHTYDWTRLTDPGRLERARSTREGRLDASLERLAALAEVD